MLSFIHIFSSYHLSQNRSHSQWRGERHWRNCGLDSSLWMSLWLPPQWSGTSRVSDLWTVEQRRSNMHWYEAWLIILACACLKNDLIVKHAIFWVEMFLCINNMRCAPDAVILKIGCRRLGCQRTSSLKTQGLFSLTQERWHFVKIWPIPICNVQCTWLERDKNAAWTNYHLARSPDVCVLQRLI